MIAYHQRSFVGGLNRELDSSKIGENEYPLLINGRVRKDRVDPIPQSTLIQQGLPDGKYQGCYAAESIMIVFIAGLAYYRDFSIEGSVFQPIVGFAMDDEVDYIYIALVQNSNVNFSRKAVSDEVNGGIELVGAITASPRCLVCQDGINQPFLIFPNSPPREAGTYADWTNDSNEEYVPIGKQMYYDGVRLYIASPDGRKIYRSVSGRPLDFMVAVDTNGDKLANEAAGDANALSHTVSYNPITGMFSTSSVDDSFLVTTEVSAHIVVPNANNTLYGEPRFINVPLFPNGTVNHFAFADILGDTALVNANGIVSYNAVLQIRNEGKNLPFSARINDFLQDIVQTVVAAIVHDNYAFFAVETVYGYGVMVFDTIRKVFVSLDMYEDIGQIKQFAEINLRGVRRLFCITTDNQLFELFSAATYENCQVYIGDEVPDAEDTEQRLLLTQCAFINPEQEGTVYATSFSDGIATEQLSAEIRETIDAPTSPVVPPFGDSTNDHVQNLPFNFVHLSKMGWKTGLWITWNFKVSLAGVVMWVEQQQSKASVSQNAQIFSGIMEGTPVVSLFTPTSGIVGTNVNIIGENFLGITVVEIGSVPVISFNVVNPNLLQVVVPIGAQTGVFRLTKAHSFTFSEEEFTVTP